MKQYLQRPRYTREKKKQENLFSKNMHNYVSSTTCYRYKTCLDNLNNYIFLINANDLSVMYYL